jgi:hypothetical protein
MANIIENSVVLQTETGPNLYYVFTTDTGLYYGNGTFETFDANHWENYVNAMPSVGPNIYRGTFPDVPEGIYNIYAYVYSSSPSIDDELVGSTVMYWNGKTESDCLSDIAVQFGIGGEEIMSTIVPSVDSIGGEIIIGVK